MKEFIDFSLRIAIFSALSALILSGVFTIADPLIQRSKAQEFQNALREVLPQAVTFQKIEKGAALYYKGLDAKKRMVGYVLPASGNGYSSTIQMLVAINEQKKIIGLKVLDQKETPGLGTRVLEIKDGEKLPWFQDQFLAKGPDEIRLVKEGGKINAITGATITSKAVSLGLQNALRSFKPVK